MKRTLGPAMMAALCLTLGCPENRTNVVGDLTAVNRILQNTRLDGQERRDALQDLGLGTDAINALLRDDRIANQDGGTLRTAFDKVRGDQLDELTPDEIQLYADAASEEDAALNVAFADNAASQIKFLFIGAGIQSADDLAAFLRDPANVTGLPADVSEDDLSSVFVEFDPALLIEQL